MEVVNKSHYGNSHLQMRQNPITVAENSWQHIFGQPSSVFAWGYITIHVFVRTKSRQKNILLSGQTFYVSGQTFHVSGQTFHASGQTFFSFF